MSESDLKSDLISLLINRLAAYTDEALDEAECNGCATCNCVTSDQCAYPDFGHNGDDEFVGFVGPTDPEQFYFGDPISVNNPIASHVPPPEPPVQAQLADAVVYRNVLNQSAIEALSTLGHLCAGGTEEQALDAATAILGYHLGVLGS